jgi:hypothetical protein
VTDTTSRNTDARMLTARITPRHQPWLTLANIKIATISSAQGCSPFHILHTPTHAQSHRAERTSFVGLQLSLELLDLALQVPDHALIAVFVPVMATGCTEQRSAMMITITIFTTYSASMWAICTDCCDVVRYKSSRPVHTAPKAQAHRGRSDVPRDGVGDALRPICVLQRAHGLAVVVVRRRDGRDHHSHGVAAEGLLQQARQFAVTVGDHLLALPASTTEV